MNKALRELAQRGLIYQCTNQRALEQHLNQSRSVYAGFDPTASSLHVGNLLMLLGLLHFQIAGHQPIALVGGATALIGDPSGKANERKRIDNPSLHSNQSKITRQLKMLLANGREYAKRRGFEVEKEALIVDNNEWYRNMSLMEFMDSVGRYSRIGQMINKDSVKSRLQSEEGLSYTEFSYQLFQAHDFWHLFREKDCTIQIGGSDQYGNITSGLELIRKKGASLGITKSDVCFGLTFPLLTTDSGEKFGKSEGNAIYMDSEHVSVYDFYNYFRKIPDSQVETLLQYFTLLPKKVIESTMYEHKISPKRQIAQRLLAAEVTELVHGVIDAKIAVAKSNFLFDKDLVEMKSPEIKHLFKDDENFTILPIGEIRDLANVIVKSGALASKCKSY